MDGPGCGAAILAAHVQAESLPSACPLWWAMEKGFTMKSTCMNKPVLGMMGIVVALALLSVAGCGDKSDSSKHINAKGRVTGIDLTSGQVKMLWYRSKGDLEISGTLAPNAEILINGRTVRLEDVQIGDSVEVIGRVENKNSIVATQVHIKRVVATEPEAHSTQPAK